MQIQFQYFVNVQFLSENWLVLLSLFGFISEVKMILIIKLVFHLTRNYYFFRASEEIGNIHAGTAFETSTHCLLIKPYI
jgi:hypothetical protein